MRFLDSPLAAFVLMAGSSLSRFVDIAYMLPYLLAATSGILDAIYMEVVLLLQHAAVLRLALLRDNSIHQMTPIQ
jgi:hypothetical protein